MQEKKDYTLDLVKQRKESIDQVSPTFCLAKWLQSTVLLYNGFTHSCHHPDRHKIDKNDLVNNAQGIHNTPVKMAARKDMLNGVQTKECSYCWNIENLDKSHLSDRIYKSTYSWSFPRLNEVLESQQGAMITPSYLEIAFDSACNCKCLYCNPESSSSWQKEIQEFGPVPQVGSPLYDLGYIKKIGALPIPQGEPNPYVDAFWKWWPEIYKKLKVLRITGGEPLLSPNTWKLFDLIQQDPRSDLNFSINSNLCLPRLTIEKLVQKINQMEPHLQSFEIYSSLESIGSQAEYVRFGMKFDEFLDNCRYVLDQTSVNVRLHFMTTINVLSAPQFLDFLKLIVELRKKYRITSHNFRLRTFFNYLRWPNCFSIAMLSDADKEIYGEQWISFVEKHQIKQNLTADQFFYDEEVEQIKRLVDYMKSFRPPQKEYENFRLFIKSTDQRRKTNFGETFPQFAHYLEKDYYGL